MRAKWRKKRVRRLKRKRRKVNSSNYLILTPKILDASSIQVIMLHLADGRISPSGWSFWSVTADARWNKYSYWWPYFLCVFVFISYRVFRELQWLQSVCIISELLDYRHSHWLHFIIRLFLLLFLKMVKSISDDVRRVIVNHVSLSRWFVLESSEAEDASQGPDAWCFVDHLSESSRPILMKIEVTVS